LRWLWAGLEAVLAAFEDAHGLAAGVARVDAVGDDQDVRIGDRLGW